MRRVLPVVLALLGVLVWQAPAHAATHTVTLATSGPSPSAVTIAVGDTVTFKAADANTYHVRRTSGSWTFTATVTQGKPVTTAAFTAAGTYGYAMTFDTLIGESPPQNGSVVVPSTSPTPTPSATRSASPRPSATARPSGSASPTAVPTQSGVAVPPPIQGGVVPTPSATPSPGPAPQVAPPGRPATPTPEPTATSSVSYAPKAELAQKSAHGMGLPAALAVVGVVGVVSLIVRLLLAAPEARPDVG